MPRFRVFLLLSLASALAAAGARAGAGRLVLGTHDPALASALSVAVSPRGLSVVELPEPLARASDLDAARREVAVQDAVAVVWLCEDDHGARALCFCGRDGRLVVRPVNVASPLSAPDAAALAISVKILLGPAAPAPPANGTPPTPPAPAAPPAPVAPGANGERGLELPALTCELAAGVRVQSPAPRLGARFGFKGAYAPDALDRRVAFGLGLSGGPRQTVSDVAVGVFARGRLQARPLWLELDVGPSAHFLSADVTPGGATSRRTEVSLDALLGAVLPLGPYFAGLRAGGSYVPASSTAAAALPTWNGEAVLIFGANVL